MGTLLVLLNVIYNMPKQKESCTNNN